MNVFCSPIYRSDAGITKEASYLVEPGCAHHGVGPGAFHILRLGRLERAVQSRAGGHGGRRRGIHHQALLRGRTRHLPTQQVFFSVLIIRTNPIWANRDPALMRIRIHIGSSSIKSMVRSGSVLGIRFRIQEAKNDPQKYKCITASGS